MTSEGKDSNKQKPEQQASSLCIITSSDKVHKAVFQMNK